LVIRLLIVAFVTAIFFSNASLASDKALVIGIGDTISISVYNEIDLSVRVRVGPSGQVNVPLIGDVFVVNKTVKTLSKELEIAFKDGYLVTPSVTVIIELYRPFYIKGAVK